jgi:hypothetical protein
MSDVADDAELEARVGRLEAALMAMGESLGSGGAGGSAGAGGAAGGGGGAPGGGGGAGGTAIRTTTNQPRTQGNARGYCVA